jgi:hypothetical protein
MNNKPAHEIRNGGVKVTIWLNEDQGKTRYSATVSRSYKAGEEWKQTTSFLKSHLSKLSTALAQAEQWIAERESLPRHHRIVKSVVSQPDMAFDASVSQ